MTQTLYIRVGQMATYTIPDVASGVSTLTANQDNHYHRSYFY